jgi:hypothetical protein
MPFAMCSDDTLNAVLCPEFITNVRFDASGNKAQPTFITIAFLGCEVNRENHVFHTYDSEDVESWLDEMFYFFHNIVALDVMSAAELKTRMAVGVPGTMLLTREQENTLIGEGFYPGFTDVSDTTGLAKEMYELLEKFAQAPPDSFSVAEQFELLAWKDDDEEEEEEPEPAVSPEKNKKKRAAAAASPEEEPASSGETLSVGRVGASKPHPSPGKKAKTTTEDALDLEFDM